MKCVKRRPRPAKKIIIMVPYPAQGHVTPMLQLASVFLGRGFKPVVVIPEFIHRKINVVPKLSPRQDHEEDIDICCMSIPDGLDEETPRDFFAIEMAMENNMPIHLEHLVRKFLQEQEQEQDEDGGGGIIACMVIDLLASWAFKVASELGVKVAGFWPAMLATYRLIAAIPNMLRNGIISETGNPQLKGPICVLPGQPMLSTEDLPWLIGPSAARISRFKFWTRTLDRSKTLRWLLVNSFPEEECCCRDYKKQNDHELIISTTTTDQDGCRPFIFPVGPLSKHALSWKNALSFWEEDMTCLDWLDQQRACSVVYVSFGSWVSPIGEGKIRSLALALEASGRPFIWVLGLSWRQGLPEGYLERLVVLSKNKNKKQLGKVVSWAPQMEVLRHEAVGCYLTHCGWNSTMEAIQSMKPLLCYPVAGDQFVNCAYIVKVWQIGLKIREFDQREVEEGLKRVMEDGSNSMKQSLIRLNERIMGMEARSSVIANLTTFIDVLKTSRN